MPLEITDLEPEEQQGIKAALGLGNVDNTPDTEKPVSSAQAAAIAGRALAIQTQTGNFTAVKGGRYITEGNVIIADPAGANSVGDSYEVWIGSGTATIGGVVYQPSRFSLRRRCSAGGTPGTWATPAPFLTDPLDFATAARSATRNNLGLGNVDNTSDANKPISTATQTALNVGTRNMQKLRRRVCSTRMFMSNGAGSDLTVQTRTFTYNVQATDSATDLQVMWANQTDGRQVTIKASLVIGSSLYPLHFNGSRFGVLAPGAKLLSDPLGMRVAKGTVFEIRTYADAGAGNVIKPNGSQGVWAYGGTWTGGSTGIADYTDVASPPALETQSYNGIVPYCVVGLCNTNCLLVVGDSISAGGYISNLFSWQRENFGASAGSVFNQVHVGRNANIAFIAHGGEAARNWNTYWIKRGMAPYCDVAIVAYGANESNDPVATIQANLQAIWNDLHAMGIRVWACTITPSTTSTDGWATVANQTDIRPNIITVNNWIRTMPAPLVGVIDVSDAVSSARNSGRWAAGFTSDGLHPNLTGQVPLQSIIPAGILD